MARVCLGHLSPDRAAVVDSSMNGFSHIKAVSTLPVGVAHRIPPLVSAGMPAGASPSPTVSSPSGPPALTTPWGQGASELERQDCPCPPKVKSLDCISW